MQFFSIHNEHFVFNHSYVAENPPENFFPHTHDSPEILFIVRADACHVIEGKEYKLAPMDLVVVPPAAYHCIKPYSNAPYERYDIICSPEILDGANVEKIYRNINVINCARHDIITDIFRKTDYYANVLERENFERIARLLICEIFCNLGIYDNTENASPNYVSATLSEALKYINDNLYTIDSVSQISKKLYVTDSYLFELFKTQLKTSPKKYITAKRLHAARGAILCGGKPTEVFGRFGFGDYASFYRSYTRFFGHSPSHEKEYKFTGAKFGI